MWLILRIQIQEENEEESPVSSTTACTDKGTSSATPKHHPTPLHRNGKSGVGGGSKKQQQQTQNDNASVSCNKCRPNSREKISVVPVDNNGGGGVHKHGLSSMASPNGIFKSIISSLTKNIKTPKPSSGGAADSSVTAAREEQWKLAVAEVSHKLIQATRKRDEAVLEASRLKYSMAELEKKLNKLEIYCHGLKSGLDECSGNSNNISSPYRKRHHHNPIPSSNEKEIVESFLVAVAESRTAVRLLSRSLTAQLRHMGAKIHDRIAVLLQPYDVKISGLSKNPRTLLFFLEALLNRAFFEDFESAGFHRSSAAQILDPVERCDANAASFRLLKGLTWEEVLSKGTRHFSEDFSRFCDRKMSEIVAMLGWNRAWPEPLLQAFFGASKSVWLVHLLANSVHPGLTVFRVDKEAGFDPVYMEDMGGDKARKLVPSIVRMMVAPGFYVFGSVVKCKVLCRYVNIYHYYYGNTIILKIITIIMSLFIVRIYMQHMFLKFIGIS